MNRSPRALPAIEPGNQRARLVFITLAALLGLASATAFAQSPSAQRPDAVTIGGTVRTSTGEPVADASVLLREKDQCISIEAKTDKDGTFVFYARGPGTYTLTAEKSGWPMVVSNSLVLSSGEKRHVELVLESSATVHPDSSGSSPSSAAPPAMEFDDKPNFTVAGVTDWNNTGTHGSDVNVRTSEALAKETLALKGSTSAENLLTDAKAGAASGNTGESERELRAARAQTQKMLGNADTADGHRLLGELDERLGDPLEAVREYQRAALMDPSERNYFEWGAELLLHRADRPAMEVFTKGFSAHPGSARMLAGLGAALYAGGNYEEAARRLCEASDLNPANPAPYLFLGKMQKAVPALLPCGEQKLARFVRDQPGNAQASYYYGIVLWKRYRGLENAPGLQQAESLLEKAVTIDPQFGEARLQLGILHSERGNLEQAIRDYKKAMEVSPQLSETHYRLGLAYRRMSEESKAGQEFRVYEQMEKAETAALERQRRELRQFLVILKDQPAPTPPR